MDSIKKSKLLSDTVLYKKKSVFETETKEELDNMMSFAENYKVWLDSSKTEREAVINTVDILKKKGFKEYKLGDKVKAGDKLFLNNRGKNLFGIFIGKENIEKGVRICAAHIDSPRLDLKPNPLYESDGVGYFKTHYYGGIKKYQWATIPLALHGVVTLSNGTTVQVNIGEEENDPKFCISDLLPHLAKDQMQKTLSDAFTGEGLNIMIASSPYTDEDGIVTDNGVKLHIMSILNEKYGIVEADFLTAELTAVPAGKSVDIGLDRWLIGGYGHDDRCCAYPSIMALIDSDETEHTLIVTLADKEEIGSEGVTGMKSYILEDLINNLSAELNANPSVVRANSMCLSADVSSAHDPNYPEVTEKNNSALLHCGVAVAKYTGARGKAGTNDASSEFAGLVRNIFDTNNVIWQMAELGKVDQGGGGTVAMYISQKNINTIDIGVPVISMHAPFEIISKADLYETYKACVAFFK